MAMPVTPPAARCTSALPTSSAIIPAAILARAQALATSGKATLEEGVGLGAHDGYAVFCVQKRSKAYALSVQCAPQAPAFALERAFSRWAGTHRFGPPLAAWLDQDARDAFAVELPKSAPLSAHEARKPDTIANLFVQLCELHNAQPPVALHIAHTYPHAAHTALTRLSGAVLAPDLSLERLTSLLGTIERHLKPQQRHSALVHGQFWPQHVFRIEALTLEKTLSVRSDKHSVRFAEPIDETPPEQQPKRFFLSHWGQAHLGDPIEDIAGFAAHAEFNGAELKAALRTYMGRRPERYFVHQARLYMAAVHLEQYVAALCSGDVKAAARWRSHLLRDERRFGRGFGLVQWLAERIPCL